MSDQAIEVKINDVVQIAPHPTLKEPFHFKLATVDEVRSWGVRAYVATFQGDAYVRLPWGAFEVIGPAKFVRVEGPENPA